jgi:HAD superfamily hydrolase (TIGR01549 family)
VKAVVFDVGETLVDETRAWEGVADTAGVPRFTLMALVGVAIERGESHKKVFEWLGVEPQRSALLDEQLYPDAKPCLSRLGEAGYLVGAVGNMAIDHESLIRPHVALVASSERWGVEKPAPAFFERVCSETGCEPGEIAYVGDRVDNDVVPALEAGMISVHIRRGPWGHAHGPPAEAIRIDSLAQLPERIAHV